MLGWCWSSESVEIHWSYFIVNWKMWYSRTRTRTRTRTIIRIRIIIRIRLRLCNYNIKTSKSISSTWFCFRLR